MVFQEPPGDCEIDDSRPECQTGGGPPDTPPDTGGTGGTGDCPPGQGILYPGGPCVGGSQAGPQPYGDHGGDDWPSYFGPNSIDFNFGPVPRFNAPRFTPPSAEDALNEPGYQFRLGQGEQALQQSAAARGHLRTGGTLKDIIGYGQQFASQEYGNVFNRALSTFDRLYQGSRDEYMPLLTEWQTNAQGKQRAGELNFNRAWQKYLADIERYKFGHVDANTLFGAELG